MWGYYIGKYNNQQLHKNTTTWGYYIGISLQTDLVGIKYGKLSSEGGGDEQLNFRPMNEQSNNHPAASQPSDYLTTCDTNSHSYVICP